MSRYVSRGSRWLAALAVGGLALHATAATAVPGGGSSHPLDEIVPPARERVHEGLRRLRDPKAPPIQQLAAELRLSAAGECAALLEILARRRVPPSGTERAQRLSESQRELVLALLAGMPRAQVLAALEALLLAPEDPSWQLAYVEVLGAIGGPADLDLLLGRAELALGELSVAPLEPVLQRSAARWFRRSPQSIDGLASRWRRLSAELLPALLEAAGASGDPRALAWVAEVVAAGSPALPVALAQIPLLGPFDEAHRNEELSSSLHSLLDPHRPELARTAALALATLGDEECVPLLVELLEAEDGGLRSNALWALRRICGQSFPATPALWKRWHEAELRWFETRSSAVLDELAGDDEARAAEAVRELGQRRLRRAWLVDALELALEHRSPSIRALGCRALGELSHPQASTLLEQMLEDQDERVAEAAASALERLAAARPLVRRAPGVPE